MTFRLHAPAIGGPHQFAHFLPVAFELAARGAADVSIFVPSREDGQEVAELAMALGMRLPPVIEMRLPPWLAHALPAKAHKLARLLFWVRRLRTCDAILCAERTSTILKRLPGICPPLIHIPHGAGDRAVGFEGRFRFFDKVIVAGSKDRDRLVSEGVTSQDRCDVAGPIKVAALSKARAGSPALFRNRRPVLLYNPHFSKSLSSADAFVHRLVAAVANDTRYNLVVAPHIRMAQGWSARRRSEWESLAIDDRVLVDLGSRRSIDMTYTAAADLYIGDVSSQVYEFLIRPRPCLFVNAHGAAWEASENYAMWRLGEVIAPDCDVLDAIERAFATHQTFKPLQVARAQAALDGLDWDDAGMPTFASRDPIARGASLVEQAFFPGSDFQRLTSAVSAI